jgi:hypothetical protein
VSLSLASVLAILKLGYRVLSGWLGFASDPVAEFRVVDRSGERHLEWIHVEVANVGQRHARTTRTMQQATAGLVVHGLGAFELVWSSPDRPRPQRACAIPRGGRGSLPLVLRAATDDDVYGPIDADVCYLTDIRHWQGDRTVIAPGHHRLDLTVSYEGAEPIVGRYRLEVPGDRTRRLSLHEIVSV